MKRLLSLAVLFALGTAQGADRVAYVDRQVVRYVGDKATVVTEQVAVVVSDPPVIVKAVPAVAARTFPRAVNYGRASGHNCPGCRQEQTIQAGRGPVRGTHRHVCSNCSSSWFH